MNFDLQQEISDQSLEELSNILEPVNLTEFQREFQILNREAILTAKQILKQLHLMNVKDQDKFVNILLTGQYY